MALEEELPDNARLASGLEELGALLEVAGSGYYAARAYRKAGELIRGAPVSVAGLVRENRVRQLRGIGPGIEARLRELVETGELAEVRELRRTVSPELAALGQMLGFGARRGAAIGAALGIASVAELNAAARAGRLREVPGIGPRTEARILAALEADPSAPPRSMLLNQARELSEKLAAALRGIAAGDARRWKDEVRRLVIVVPSEQPGAVREQFAALPEVVALLEPDLGVSSDGIPIELVITSDAHLGTALVRATGSAAYVAALEPLPPAPDEEALFRQLEIPFLPPELREAPGSLEPPGLLQIDQIRGDLHVHTTWSDGKATVLEMAESARRRGYDYLAICDHTLNVTVVPGLDAPALRRQADEIAAANKLVEPFRVLRGVECDIRSDGSLDLPDDILGELDWVQLSLHAGQRAPRRELTARVTHAMQHPAVRCLSHPTGRLIGHRPENALDLAVTIETALETGVALEVNGLPNRLDLKSEYVRIVVESGAKIVCSTDAHSTHGLSNMPLTVHTARRGRARAADVLNTGSLADILRPVDPSTALAR